MNQEKINEIAVKSGAYWRDGYSEKSNGDLAWSEKVKVDIVDMDLNKFAELIILECAKVADEPGARIPSYYIKKHFGVKE